METDNQPTAGSSNAHVGAGALTRPAERSSADVVSAAQFEAKTWRAALARPDEGVRAYV